MRTEIEVSSVRTHLAGQTILIGQGKASDPRSLASSHTRMAYSPMLRSHTRRSLRRALWGFAGALLVALPAFWAYPALTQSAEKAESVPGRLYVRFAAESQAPAPGKTASAAFSAAAATHGMTRLEKAFPFLDTLAERRALSPSAEALRHVYALTYTSGAEPADASQAFARDAGVVYAEPQPVHRIGGVRLPARVSGGALAAPNDSLYGEQTHLPRLQLPEAWDEVKGEDGQVLIAIVDTGVDIAHPDLRDNLWRNPNETPGNGLDDDGNGFTDDVYGWNFTEDSPDPYGDGTGSDHGTAVAGVAAAATDNARGIAGASWNAAFMPVRTACEGSAETLCHTNKGVLYAALNGADIITASFGSSVYSETSWLVMQATLEAGALVVASAGNAEKDNDAAPYYPASYPSVLSVGGTKKDSQENVFSYGRSVNVYAPAEAIETTAPEGGYARWSGTSFSVPLVAGVAALAKTANPQFGPEALREQVRLTADKTSDEYAHAFVNAWRAATEAPRPAIRIAAVNGRPHRGEYVNLPGADTSSVRITFANAHGDARDVAVRFEAQAEYARIAPASVRLGRLARGDTASVDVSLLLGAGRPAIGAFLVAAQVTADGFVDEPDLVRLRAGRFANAQDSLALVAFYHAAGGEDWIDRTGWHGVTLNEEGRVVRLAVFQNNLTGHLSSQLGRLTELEHLDLTDNNLGGSIPASLGGLAKLKILSLSFNRLTGPVPPALGNLAELEDLNFQINDLTGSIPASLGRLAKLKSLYLSWNGLTGPVPPELGNLAELEALSLQFNGLTGPVPASLGRLAKLKRLFLSWNGLTGPVPAALGNLAELEVLSLQINGLTGPIPARLGELSRLKGLYLSDNALTGSIPPALGNLANLENLVLFDNPLAPYAFPEWITALVNLWEISLTGTRLRGAIPPGLGDLPKLRHLYLSHNDLEGALPGNIANAKALSRLYLNDNNLNALADLSGLPELERVNVAFNRLTFEDFEGVRLPASVAEPLGAPDRERLAALFERTGFVTEAQGPLAPVTLAASRPPDPEALRRYIDALNALQEQDKGDIVPAGHLRALPRLYRRLAERTERFPQGKEAQASASVSDFTYAPQRLVPTRVAREADHVTFSVEVGGEENAYQWYGDGYGNFTDDDMAIEGATSNTLRVALSEARAVYYCVITNPRVPDLTLYSKRVSSVAPEHIVTAHEADSLVLANFYRATGGSGWTNDLDWLEGPLGSWFGVALNEAGRVTELYLVENNLTGLLPEEVGALAALERLELGRNEMSGRLPESLGRLTSLTHLTLDSNRFFRGPIPASLGNLTRLRILSLGNNGLRGPIPEALGNLTSLVSLDLSNNNLTGPVPAWLGNLTRLTHILLYSNGLRGPIPEELGKLASLERLHLKGNNLTGGIPASLGRLTRLDGLFLDENALEGAVPDSILAMNALEWLYLNDNRLTSLPDLTGMPRLHTVHASSNRLSFEDVEQHARFSGTFTYAPQEAVPVRVARSASHATFSVGVGGTANEYQWYREGFLDDEAIPGATADTLAVPLSDPPTRYRCRITNAKAPDLTLYSERASSAEVYTSIAKEDVLTFAVHANYPNPFSEATEIAFETPEAAHVRITVYDALGRRVDEALDQTVAPGRYRVAYAARDLAPGTYFYHIEMGRFSETRAMVLVR